MCHAGTRIYVHEDVYDAFMAAFTKKMAEITIGTNFSSDTDQGAIINKQQFDKIMGYIKDGKDQGATLYLGGKSVAREGGYFVQPTIFTNVTPDMKVRKSHCGSQKGPWKLTLQSRLSRKKSLDQ